MRGKKFLIWDGGSLSMEHAARLARDGNEVLYYTYWQTAFPSFKDYATGLGIPGITKVDYFNDWIDKADAVVFFDIGAGDLCADIRKTRPNKPVYGAGIGERLEFHRILFRKLQKSLGLPVQETEVIKGIDKLKEYIEKHPDVYVKIDRFREDMSTFPAKYMSDVEPKIRFSLGPFANEIEFICEKEIDAIAELGSDAFF